MMMQMRCTHAKLPDPKDGTILVQRGKKGTSAIDTLVRILNIQPIKD